VLGAKHFSETIGAEVRLAGGYGLENAVYTELAGPIYGVAVEAYRYLASAEADLQWTPIYAKMNFGGKKVIHHDVYFLVGAGVTLEQSLIPDYDIVLAPTIPVGVGTRIYVAKNTMLRAELRDSMLIEHRVQSDTVAFKQNVAMSLGLSVLLGETR
jgi:outer membrane beta-barrel protein